MPFLASDNLRLCAVRATGNALCIDLLRADGVKRNLGNTDLKEGLRMMELSFNRNNACA